MSEAPSSPNWSLLPRSPQAFFELSDGFDRKDLKRAYNRWLRVYRPEKFPVEFQKLREAYEFLESQDRYHSAGAGNAFNVVLNDATESLENKNEVAGPDDSNTQEIVIQTNSAPKVSDRQTSMPEANWRTQLPSIDPRELYHRLKANSSHSADDYAALALLSDSTKIPDPSNFALWLIDGLKKYPNDGVISYLLRSFFSSDSVTAASIEMLLLKLSESSNSDQFYYLAEPLLDKCLNEKSWSDFKRVLAACQSKFSTYQSHGHMAYQCHLLRRALWKAPIEESLQLVAYIEKECEFKDRHTEYAFEIDLRLLEYVKIRHLFVTMGPVSQMIDRSLMSFCFDKHDRGLRSVVKCQQYISQHPDDLFKEFPVAYPLQLRACQVWSWVGEYVLQDLAISDDESIPSERSILQLVEQFAEVPTSLALIGTQIANILVTLAVIIASLALMVATILPGIILIGVYFWKLKKYVDQWFGKITDNIKVVQYQKWCRDSFARYHAASHSSFEDVQAELRQIQVLRRNDLLQAIPAIYSHDPAMPLYSTAAKFDR